MGGWSNGVNAKMVGVPDPAIVWVGYSDRASGLTTTLCIEERPDDGEGIEVWVDMDIEGWKRLRDEINEAIETLQAAGQE